MTVHSKTPVTDAMTKERLDEKDACMQMLDQALEGNDVTCDICFSGDAKKLVERNYGIEDMRPLLQEIRTFLEMEGNTGCGRSYRFPIRSCQILGLTLAISHPISTPDLTVRKDQPRLEIALHHNPVV